MRMRPTRFPEAPATFAENVARTRLQQCDGHFVMETTSPIDRPSAAPASGPPPPPQQQQQQQLLKRVFSREGSAAPTLRESEPKRRKTSVDGTSPTEPQKHSTGSPLPTVPAGEPSAVLAEHAAGEVPLVSNSNVDTPNMAIGKVGEVTVVNDAALLKEDHRVLGHVIYRPPKRRVISSDDPADLDLFLLPPFNSDHLYATIEVRIAAEHLSFNSNLGVKARALWGTDIYTDDSDIVAVIIHSGFYRPADCPPLLHHVTTTTAIIDDFKDAVLSRKKESQSENFDPSTQSATAGASSTEAPTPVQRVPTVSARTLVATPDPAMPSRSLHDIVVTLRVLPRLRKYTGTQCTLAGSSLHEGQNGGAEGLVTGMTGGAFGLSGFASRGWGGSHQGESIRVERVVEVQRDRSFAPTNGRNMSRLGRKRGVIEWCSVGADERMLGDVVPAAATSGSGILVGNVLTGVSGSIIGVPGGGIKNGGLNPPARDYSKVVNLARRKSVVLETSPVPGGIGVFALTVARKEIHDAARILFSSVDGRPCLKYSPQLLNEWPKYLQDSLVDLNGTFKARVDEFSDKLPSNHSLGLSGSELKRMEGWAFWRVRLSIPGTVLFLEDCSGSRYKVEREKSTNAADGYKVSGIPNVSPTVVNLSDIDWRIGGMYIRTMQQLLETDRFFFKQ
ncbi:transcriptional regulatory protein rxt3 [Entophlyctis sp. JEL0112]|nr:transcriptional regulatory protein rxt3 [Entophlyctis sp. JEL0112]